MIKRCLLFAFGQPSTALYRGWNLFSHRTVPWAYDETSGHSCAEKFFQHHSLEDEPVQVAFPNHRP